MKRLRLSTLLVLGALAAVAPATASAAGSDPAAAQALFNDAKTLMTQNRWAEACPKLEESEKLDPGIGTQFHLANCYEHIGRTASAWAGFLETAAASKAAGQPAREKAARDRASALEPKLSRLNITLRGADPLNLKVMRDGIEVGRGQWSTPVPIDPGEHRITASAPGKRTWEKVVRVPPDAKVTVVEVPALVDEPAAPPPAVAVAPVPAPAPAVANAPPPNAAPPVANASTSASTNGYASAPRPLTTPPGEPDDPGRTQRTVGWVLGGVGLAGLGVGAAFGVLSKQRHDQATSHCDANDVCDPTGVSLRHEAVQYGTVSTVGFIGGGAGVLVGLVTLATAPKAEHARDTARAHWEAAPLIGSGTSGMAVRGSF